MNDSRGPETAAFLIVGDEILSGEIADENAAYMTAALTPLGVRVREMRVVPDELDVIERALRSLGELADVVFVTGGIGPTHDDVTREAVAVALGRELARHADAEARLRGGFGSSITDDELTMADLPRGAELVCGRTTPVFGFVVGSVFVLPGVPYYLRDLFDPIVEAWAGRPYHRDEHLTRQREGRLAAELRRLQESYPQVAIGSYPIREDGFATRIVVRSFDAEAVPAVMAEIATIAPS